MKYVFFVLSTLFFSFCFAQNSRNITTIIPPIPEVANFTKQLEFPSGLQSGIASINIPIYNINDKVKIPISLNYNASGIKVEENATWVGLGWNLDCGGSLTRVVKGMPDDISNVGYMYTPYTVSFIQNLSVNDPLYFDLLYNQIFDQLSLDVEPDLYFFSAGSYSGKFFFNKSSNKFELLPYQNIKIEYFTSIGKIVSFIITTPDGAKYYFGKSYDNQRESYDTYQTQDSYFQNGGAGWQLSTSNNSTPPHVVSWKLMNIEKDKDIVVFEYSNPYSAIDYNRIGETRDFKGISNCDATSNLSLPITSLSIQHSDKTRLERIKYKNVTVEFIRSQIGRQDTHALDYSLERVNVKNKDNLIIQTTKLSYLYSESSDNFFEGIGNSIVFKKRLFLKEVMQKNINEEIPPYQFEYHGIDDLPSKLSKSQDYWGFYNGKTNSTLIPTIPTSLLNSSSIGYINGGDRTVDINYAKKGTLVKVKYPTGGETIFDYESNTIDPSNSNLFWGFQQSGLVNKGTNFFKSSLFQSASNSNLYTQQFVVNSVDNIAFVAAFLEGCSNDIPNIDCALDIKIIGITNPAYIQQINSSNLYVNLPSGTYKLEALITPNANYSNPDFNIHISWKENPNVNSLIVGGIRIKKVIKKDNQNGNIIRTYNYNNFLTGNSSGMVYNTPVNSYYIFCGSTEFNPSILRIVSNSVLPTATVDGKQIQYFNVAEYQESINQNLKSEYIFSQLKYIPFSHRSWDYPHTTDLTQTWRSGLLLGKKVYEYHGLNYELIESEENVYNNFNTSNTLNLGLVVGSYPSQQSFGTNTYGISNEWYLPTKKIIKYYRNGFVNGAITDYLYDNNYQLKSQTTVNSKNETLITTYKYPYDFQGIPIYDQMVSKNMISYPIETKTMNQTVGTILDWKYQNYRDVGNGIIDVKWIDVYDRQKNMFTTEVNYDQYDSKGNLEQLTTKQGVTQSYVYGYSKNYPIAQVVNAKVNEVYHENFEESTNGWGQYTPVLDFTKSHTGRASAKLFNPTGSEYVSHAPNWLSVNITTPTKYKYSGWIYSDGPSAELFFFMKYNPNSGTYFDFVTSAITTATHQWVYVEGEYTVPAGITAIQLRLDNNGGGTVWFDDLRIYPSAAQMTTYTYEPLIGMSSQSDANNRTTYYEYDGFNRLSLIRDQNRNILKKYCYNYQGQSQACQLFSCAAVSGDYYSQNCGSQTPEAIFVDVPAGQFSSSISQADADAQAQAYAQDYANQHGTCISNEFEFNYNNYINAFGTAVEMYNHNTGQYYYFQVGYGSGVLGNISAGNYDVNVYTGYYSYFNCDIGCGYYSGGWGSTYFYSIFLDAYCNTINFY